MTRPPSTFLLIVAILVGVAGFFTLAEACAGAGAHPRGYYPLARKVVYATFGPRTAPAAMRVVACETGHTYSPWSFNRSSAATGLFQVLRGNGGRHLHYAGKSLVIDGSRLFNPWYNARVAWFLSRGGTDWHEWAPVCRPG